MRLNVAFSSDENYARHIGVSMLSLFQNNINFDEIYVYIIDSDIKQETKCELNNIAKRYNRRLIYIPFEEMCAELNTDNNYSLSSYGRLFLSRIKEIDKVLYLDCDSIVISSLKNLWEEDIEQFYVAGVQDNVNVFYKTGVGLNKNYRYVNAGFLLVNLKKWREEEIENKFLNFIDDYKGSVPHHDQGVINAVCNEHILILHPRYNVQCPMFQYSCDQILKLDHITSYYTQKEINDAIDNPCFIHFTNGFFNRPWNKDSTHPLKNKYLEYLDQTPWNKNILDNKLCINARIMRSLHKYLPFPIYSRINDVVTLKKTIIFFGRQVVK